LKLVRSFSVYAFTLASNAVVSFATFSLLTHYLNETDYGIINLYNSFFVFTMPFISVGVPFTLSVDYFKVNSNEFRTYFTNAMAIPALACLLLTVIFLIFIYPLHHFIKVNFFFTILIPFTCFMTVLNDVIMNIIRNRESHKLFAVFSIGKNLFEIAVTIIFIIGLGYAWQGRLSGALIALLFATFIAWLLIKRWHLYNGLFDASRIKKIFLLGLPFVPERLAIFIIFYSDRFFIDHYQGTGDVGYYSAGAQLAMIVNMIVIALNNAFYPYLYKKLSVEIIDYSSIRKASLAFLGISALIAIGLIVCTPLIFKYFVGDALQPGRKYAIYLTLASFSWAVYNAFIVFLLNLKKNKIIMIISTVGMIVSLSFNFFNVKTFGALGAAYTAIIVYSLMAGITIYFVHKYYNLRKILFSS
jgi:O-antigen/teichoic acid export membrane protein